MSSPAPHADPDFGVARMEAESGTVRGERATALVSSLRSLQARASSMLAAGLMIALGLGALSWYYAHAFTRQTRAHASAQASAASRAQGEMPLPALGPIGVMTAAAPAPGPPLAPPPEVPLTEAAPQGLPGTAGAAAVPAPRTAGELALQRRLEGAVFAREATTAAPMMTPGAATVAPVHNGSEPTATPLAGWLTPTVAAAVPAQRLADARLLLPKGAFIDCTLETAIDSTLPGLTTCITAADTFSADGKVVLLERGTKLLGETRGAVQQGQARLFVLWTQARTPPGVIVPLDSPGTDELGRAGVTGEVQRHFWQRFGAAILISVVNGAVLAGVQAASPSNGTVIYAPSGSQDVLTEAMKDSMHIVPTIAVRNGARIQVLVARDIDFRPVYELRAAAAR